MRNWQAIPVAGAAALLAAVALFAGGNATTTYAVSDALSIDCNTGSGGIQSSCVLPAFPGQTTLTVDIVFTNNSGAPEQLAAFNFDVFDPDKTVINPSGPPARNATALFLVTWSCAGPAADTGNYAAPAADSFLSCLDNSGLGNTIPTGDTVIASLTYSVLKDGVSDLVLFNAAAADQNTVPLVACDAASGPPTPPGTNANPVSGPCAGANIQVGASSATSTPVPPTATPTATATPCVSNCPPTATPTSLAYVTITPNAATLTATAPTAVPATAAPPPPGGGEQPGGGGGQPTGNAPGGGAGAGGSGPITLPDTGAGHDGRIDWTAASLLALVAVAIGGAAGAMYLGAVRVTAPRKERDD